jgi:ketosteroid isomerase-like protein
VSEHGTDHSAREAIRSLTAAYNRAFDSGDTAAWLATFTEDGALVVDDEQVYAGPGELASFCAGRAGSYHHLSTDSEIELRGSSAVQRCSLLLFHTAGTRATLVGTGRYVDDLVHTAAGWRFQRRAVAMTRVAVADAS